MKKNFLFWFASLVAVMLTLSLSSCSDNDDEPDGSSDIAKEILGVWYWAEPNDPGSITFLPDGIGYEEWEDEWGDERDYFEWSYNKKKESLFIKFKFRKLG